MGRCHYADSVGPTPGVTVGGPRPETPVSDTLGMGYYNIIQGTVGLVESTIAAGELPVNSLSVKTPYGRAWQKLTPDAFRLRSQVSNGAEIYRGGVLGQTNLAEGQFWLQKIHYFQVMLIVMVLDVIVVCPILSLPGA